MNNKIIAGILLIIFIALGFFLFKGKTQAPVTTDTEIETNSDASSNTTQNVDTKEDTSINTNVDVTSVATKEFTITGSNFKFAPNSIGVKKGDTVKITFMNSGGTHDLRIDGYNVATKVLQSGESETISFVATTAGTFEYYCSVGGHRQMGMKGTLVVTE